MLFMQINIVSRFTSGFLLQLTTIKFMNSHMSLILNWLGPKFGEAIYIWGDWILEGKYQFENWDKIQGPWRW